jgi:PPP family 3-phenylpropionic acid transporter
VGIRGFVIGSALTGKLVSLFDYRVILVLLSLGAASMLLGMMIRPSVQPAVKTVSRRAQDGPPGAR